MTPCHMCGRAQAEPPIALPVHAPSGLMLGVTNMHAGNIHTAVAVLRALIADIR